MAYGFFCGKEGNWFLKHKNRIIARQEITGKILYKLHKIQCKVKFIITKIDRKLLSQIPVDSLQVGEYHEIGNQE